VPENHLATVTDRGEVTARQPLLARKGLEAGHDFVTSIEDDRKRPLAGRCRQ